MKVYLMHRDRCHDCKKLLTQWGGRGDIEYVDVHADQERTYELLCYYDIGVDPEPGLPLVVFDRGDDDHDTARGYEECDKLLKEVLE